MLIGSMRNKDIAAMVSILIVNVRMELSSFIVKRIVPVEREVYMRVVWRINELMSGEI